MLVFMLLRFCQGIFLPGAGLTNWIIAYESVPMKMRAWAPLIFGCAWSFGFCAVAPLAAYFTNWRHFIFSNLFFCFPFSLMILGFNDQVAFVFSLERAAAAAGRRLRATCAGKFPLSRVARPHRSPPRLVAARKSLRTSPDARANRRRARRHTSSARWQPRRRQRRKGGSTVDIRFFARTLARKKTTSFHADCRLSLVRLRVCKPANRPIAN